MDRSFSYKEYIVLTSPDAKLHKALVLLTVYLSWCLFPSCPFVTGCFFSSRIYAKCRHFLFKVLKAIHACI